MKFLVGFLGLVAYAILAVIVAFLLLYPLDWLLSQFLRPELGLRNPHGIWPIVLLFNTVASFVVLRWIGRRVFR